MTAAIGIGTNLGDRNANIVRALYMLGAAKGIELLRVSSVAETVPVDFTAQPDFLNCIAIIETSLTPSELLAELQAIEKALGRTRGAAKGPRTIDLDIILYGDVLISSEELTVPHRERLKRPFILRHLAELIPDTADPVEKLSYGELFALQAQGG